VVNELRGERIDIIPWLQDPALFVSNALSPAQVTRVIINESEKAMEVIVADEELSLAIGKNGQNVRLAARLTGWNITIKSETQAEEEKSQEKAEKDKAKAGGPEPDIFEGLPGKVKEALIEAGLTDGDAISGTSDSDLLNIPGLGPKTVQKLREKAISSEGVDEE
jgi:N utilization substance protein A